MNAIILSIGDELASGLTVDTNSAWIAQQLTSIGVACGVHLTVGDRLTATVSAIQHACESLESDGGKGGVLVISGGLGPTEDDLTRQALADAMQEALVEDPDAVLQIENWFSTHRRTMSASNRLQALRPHSANILENLEGTAPGLHAQRGRTEIYVLPGVPREMKEMFVRAVLPAIQERALAEEGRPIVTLVTKVNTFGLGESVLGERIKDLMLLGRGTSDAKDNTGSLSVGTTVHEGIVSVRIYASGPAEDARQSIARVRATVNDRLAPYVFGDDDQSIEGTVAALLSERRHTLATAESCTGGLLAKLLTDTPGSSAYFLRGWVTYSNAAKQEELGVPEELLQEYGAVSQPVAEAMAEAARKLGGADFGLATTGIAGPDGGSIEKPVGTVWIGIAGAGGAHAQRFTFPGDRKAVRLRASQMALAQLRWKLLGREPVL